MRYNFLQRRLPGGYENRFFMLTKIKQYDKINTEHSKKCYHDDILI